MIKNETARKDEILPKLNLSLCKNKALSNAILALVHIISPHLEEFLCLPNFKEKETCFLSPMIN